MHVGQKCSDIGERWSSVSLYVGTDMPGGTSIRIIDDMCDLFAMKERWEEIASVCPKEDCLSFQDLLETWRQTFTGQMYSLHVLLVYSGGRVIGGIPMYARHESAWGVTTHRTLLMMNRCLTDKRTGSTAGQEKRPTCSDVLTAAENRPAVLNALASYIRYSGQYWNSIEFRNIHRDSLLVTELISILRTEEFDIKVKPAPIIRRIGLINQAGFINERLVWIIDRARHFSTSFSDQRKRHRIIPDPGYTDESNPGKFANQSTCCVTIRRKCRASLAMIYLYHVLGTFTHRIKTIPRRVIVDKLHTPPAGWLSPIVPFSSSPEGIFPVTGQLHLPPGIGNADESPRTETTSNGLKSRAPSGERNRRRIRRVTSYITLEQ